MSKIAISDYELNQIKEYVQNLIAHNPIPGGTVAIFNDSEIVAEFAFGFAELASQTPMKLSHKFEIGSISKTFTALLILSLSDDGVIDIDKPITQYLPWFDCGKPSAGITARHLMSHTSGLIMGSDHIPDEIAQVWALRDLVRSGDLGERFHYSNVGFMVLGALIQQVTGATVAEELRSRVLVPMGIPDARVGVVHADRSEMAIGHWPLHDDQTWLSGDPLTPATWFEIACADGNVAADIRELSKLGQLLLSDGRINGNQVVSVQAIEQLAQPVAPTGEDISTWGNPSNVTSSRYGLGVNVESIHEHHCVTHGGGMVGYATFLLADRTAGFGVSVLTNGNGEFPAAQQIARVIHSCLLAGFEELPSTDALVQVEELEEQSFGEFKSCLHDDTEMKIEVNSTADGLVQIICNGETGFLTRTWSERFVATNPGLRRFHFQRDGETWSYGPHLLSKKKSVVTTPASDQIALLGHYRSYSPWFTNFRIVYRSGSLFLIAAGGVEAPTADQELVEVSPGIYRIGSDVWLPERLTSGPIINGKAITVTRDGLLYSRSFTD